MNDRYLYRAKRKNWRKLPKTIWWIEGYYVHFMQNDNHCIYYEKDGLTLACDIDISTLCACTGLKDKNGKLIWENDIVEAWSQGTRARGKIYHRIVGTWIMYPEWQKGEMWYLLPNENGETTVEIIGNIFDNPELLNRKAVIKWQYAMKTNV